MTHESPKAPSVTRERASRRKTPSTMGLAVQTTACPSQRGSAQGTSEMSQQIDQNALQKERARDEKVGRLWGRGH
jgi:hypothetical protein